MTLFATPEEHAANPPATWQVNKAAERVWQLRTRDGGVLHTYTTKGAAEEGKVGGFYADQYAKDGRWYAGETPPGHRSWADCLADRERLAARRRARAGEGAG